MVLGNGRGHLAAHLINSENVVKYFTMPMVDNNVKVALALGNSINLKCSPLLKRKVNFSKNSKILHISIRHKIGGYIINLHVIGCTVNSWKQATLIILYWGQ